MGEGEVPRLVWLKAVGLWSLVALVFLFGIALVYVMFIIDLVSLGPD